MEEGVTKTNQRSLNSQVEDRGFLPYWEFFPGCNPGQMMEDHIARLPANTEFLFCKPRKLGAKLHDPEEKVLYEKSKIGKHTVAVMVTTICKLVNSKAHYTNHDLRCTGLIALKKAGIFDFSEIKKVSGHKVTKSIEENYHVGLETKTRANMMFSILNAAKLGRGDNFEPISDHLERRNAPAESQAFSACQVASSVAQTSGVNKKAESEFEDENNDEDFNDSEDEGDDLDDSVEDPNWKCPADFDLGFVSNDESSNESLLNNQEITRGKPQIGLEKRVRSDKDSITAIETKRRKSEDVTFTPGLKRPILHPHKQSVFQPPKQPGLHPSKQPGLNPGEQLRPHHGKLLGPHPPNLLSLQSAKLMGPQPAKQPGSCHSGSRPFLGKPADQLVQVPPKHGQDGLQTAQRQPVHPPPVEDELSSSVEVGSSGSAFPSSQPLLLPINEGKVRCTFLSMGVKKIALSKIKASQADIIPLPRDMLTDDVETADILFIKCINYGDDDSTSLPLFPTDGDLPIPTLKWTLAKSKNIRVVNGKVLVDWFKTRKTPNFFHIKYQTGSLCSETMKVSKPDNNPENLFADWKFLIYNFREPGITQKSLESIVVNTGGELVNLEEVQSGSSLDDEVVILGDGYLDIANKVVCPSYIIQCVQQGRLLPDEDYIYVIPR